MPVSNRLKNQHLLSRAGFGPMTAQSASLDDLSQKQLWEQLLTSSKSLPAEVGVPGLSNEPPIEEMKRSPGNSDDTTKKLMRKQARENLKTLNITWLNEMIHSGAQFRERMSLFWHGHFACRVNNAAFQQQFLHAIRTNATGNFANLLKAVSKSPAMLRFLNNQQNRKQQPNENFAREVMELFTMGTGTYSETDVKEAARAFTGWGFNLEGEFVFREKQHDGGKKTFLGRTGNFNGDDILNILLEQKATAIFITRKVVRHFVNEQANQERVQSLANRFYKSGYNIESLMTDIFTSDWFYAAENIGNKIKSPIDLLVGIRRLVPMQLRNEEAQLLVQRTLGQVLLAPPNVAGWPGGKSWIDSSTLMFRLQLPKILMGYSAPDFNPKQDDDQMMGLNEQRMFLNKRLAGEGIATMDWPAISAAFDGVERAALLTEIKRRVLQTPAGINDALLKPYIDPTSRESYIRSAIIFLMSTPEYQLC